MWTEHRAIARAVIAATCLLTAASLTSAQTGQPAYRPPPAATSNTLERSDPDMRAVLQKLQQLGAKPIHTLTVSDARNQPTPADAVDALIEARGTPAPEPAVTKQNTSYRGAANTQAARLYIPRQAEGAGPLPVILYFHGGGWVIASIDTYDASASALADKTGAIVASVEYRQSPEHKFPASHQDALAAYRWVRETAAEWGGDPSRIAVAGESAGANLAINVAIMARDNTLPPPVHMLLVYPVAGTDMTTPSYQENADAMPLGRQDMQWFFDKVLASDADRQSPMLDLIGRADLRRLPPATVITAEIDPLRSEGQALAEKLRQAGSAVTHRDYEGVTHEFFGMAAVVGDAQDAQELAARELRLAAVGGSSGAQQR